MCSFSCLISVYLNLFLFLISRTGSVVKRYCGVPEEEFIARRLKGT